MEQLKIERAWMYHQKEPGVLGNTREFMDGVDFFINMAIQRNQIYAEDLMRCPCFKCKNNYFRARSKVEEHLHKVGFVPNYFNWTQHGEELVVRQFSSAPMFDHHSEVQNSDDRFDEMILASARPSCIPSTSAENVEDEPNIVAANFYNLLTASSQPLYPGCSTETELSMAMKCLQIKTDYNMSEACYDTWCDAMKSAMPEGNKFTPNFRHTKKLVSELGMGYTRIDVCVDGCMIFYGDDSDLDECRICGKSRWKPERGGAHIEQHKKTAASQMFWLPLIPRVQRLFMNESTAKHMTWHKDYRRVDGQMVHPADGEAWKHFDTEYPTFADEPRNVRLGLCTDGFSPFGHSSNSYSCWPVMVTPYNLPPWMCMKTRVMFLSILIPGPRNPKKQLDIYLRPLIDELILLWTEGVETYDISRKKNFQMRAMLLWTINDFPAYGMLSGWSTHGRLGCPYCMEKTKAFRLKHGWKPSYFDCHRCFLPEDHPYRLDDEHFYKDRCEMSSPIPILSGEQVFDKVCHMKPIWEQTKDEKLPGFGESHNWTKRSIFWELPYWKKLKIRHNLDVMHIEKNVFDNLFNTVMNVKGKTKDDGKKCRKDIALYCNRPQLELKVVRGRCFGAKAKYELTQEQQTVVCHWIKKLKFPDGYAAKIGNHVDLEKRRLVQYKSHDAHIFMERLMPIAFRGMLPPQVWEPISELCTFFRDVCASSLDVARLEAWEKNIILTLCKLEMIFPPSFFDSMEHLPVHMAHEALMAGPVQYRWMYPFERFLYRLKSMAKNKSQIEASICIGYITQEISFLGSDYLGPEFKTKARRPRRNEVLGGNDDEQLSIFNHPGHRGRVLERRQLTSVEYWKACHYILTNCSELDPHIRVFEKHVRDVNLGGNDVELYNFAIHNLPDWLNQYMWKNRESVDPQWLCEVSLGFSWNVVTTGTYKINNYKFHTENHSLGRSTKNCHLCVKGTEGNDFYGVLEEIIHIRAKSNRLPLKVVLFKCRWFDPNWTRTYPQNGIVEVNIHKLYAPYDPFILAQQAVQVYYAPFPGMPTRTRGGWMAVCRVKPTAAIDMSLVDMPYQDDQDVGAEVPVVAEMDEIIQMAGDEMIEYSDDDEEMVEHSNDEEEMDDEEETEEDEDWMDSECGSSD